MGPAFEAPATVAHSAAEYQNVNTEHGAEPAGNWWQAIDDPLLQDYVQQLLQQNPSLQEAAERVLQAREQAAIARGGRYPSLALDASVNRSFQPANAINFTLPDERVYLTSYTAEFATGWQIDLFGRVRRAVQAADAQFEASAFDGLALTHSLIAELLSSRVAIAVTSRRLELARQSTENRHTVFELARNRYQLGARGATLADVDLAEGNYLAGKAELNALQQGLAEQIYRLDVLLGQPPGTSAPLAGDFPLLPPPREVAVCVPAALLDRRPDLRASQARLRAANAQVGVAVADLYPALNLNAGLGVRGLEASSLFSADQLAGSLIGAISTQLFAGGRLRANVRLRQAESRALAANYQGQVLEALREVETALLAERTLAQQVSDLQAATVRLRRAEESLSDRYRQGVSGLREYLQTQEQRYLTEQNWLQSQQQVWNNRIALYLALGGDWTEDAPPRTDGCNTQNEDA